MKKNYFGKFTEIVVRTIIYCFCFMMILLGISMIVERFKQNDYLGILIASIFTVLLFFWIIFVMQDLTESSDQTSMDK